MATETSSIDELLSQSLAPPQIQREVEPEIEDEQDEHEESESVEDSADSADSADEPKEEEKEENEETKPETNYDEYGNEKPAPRTFTEDEVNERINKAIRERLSRGNQQAYQQPTQQQVEQKAKDFEYNPDGEGNWQQQLEQFVEQTFNKIGQRQIAQQQSMKEQEAESEFRDKFIQGMERFNDFKEVVSSQPVTDAMTLALRGVKDPAAFIYAASKRHPTELQRISQIKDPYAQITEMGKLEERMKKQPQGTQAPRPISRSTENAPLNEKKKNTEPSIEDLIAQSEKKKMSMMKQRKGR